jgi:hypothetical protein
MASELSGTGKRVRFVRDGLDEMPLSQEATPSGKKDKSPMPSPVLGPRETKRVFLVSFNGE